MNKEKPTPHEWGAGELRVCLHTIFTKQGIRYADRQERLLNGRKRKLLFLRLSKKQFTSRKNKPDQYRLQAEKRHWTGIGNQTIVQVAASQEGKGGTTYWRWYGFGGRVEWCACFVSWCADQSGYIQSGVIPKFSLCSDGVKWFESKGRFRDGSYTPVAGDIIFFDWGNNGTIDHVGIVESVSGGTVNTIEGNSGDKVARRSYRIGSSNIYGYGVPAY